MHSLSLFYSNYVVILMGKYNFFAKSIEKCGDFGTMILWLFREGVNLTRRTEYD